MSFRIPAVFLLLVVALAAGMCGCAVHGTHWEPPVAVAPAAERSIEPCDPLAEAERLYRQASARRNHSDPACVDQFYQVARMTARFATVRNPNSRGRLLHESALRLMLQSGQRFDRFVRGKGFQINTANGPTLVPIQLEGFRFPAESIHQLIPVGEYETSALSTKHRCNGVGVPYVVKSCNCKSTPYLIDQSYIPATLVMNVDHGRSECEPAELVFHDAIVTSRIEINGQTYQLRRDLSAAIVYRLRGTQRDYLNRFLLVDDTGQSRLYMTSPYQEGKIPVVLVHGLLSDVYTWAEVVNELYARPGFDEKYQLWLFEYNTGRPFVGSASDFRDELQAIRQTLDPGGADAALSEIVLVGHSMGGLISKLQVTYSDDALWHSIASRPIDQVKMPARFRNQLSKSFFFEPLPFVSRVVFMGTPHRGSSYARRCVGRLGSALVREPEDLVREHRRLIDCNPGVFSDEFSEGIPSSIDLMDPRSKLLEAIAKLPAAPCVSMHSVIGNPCFSLFHGRSDGVVPVSSAREPRAESERFVHAKHADVNKHPDAVHELMRILDLHAAHYQCGVRHGPQKPSLPDPVLMDSDLDFRGDHPLPDAELEPKMEWEIDPDAEEDRLEQSIELLPYPVESASTGSVIHAAF